MRENQEVRSEHQEERNCVVDLGNMNVDNMSVEEFFNAQCETIAVALHRAGLEYNRNGKLGWIDTPYAMGIKQGEDIIAKQLK